MSKYKSLFIASAAAVLLIAVGIFLMSKPTTPAQPANTSTATQPQTGPRYWIITSSALGEISADGKVQAALKNDTIYAPGYNPATATAAERNLNIIPTATYQSEAQFAADLTNGKIPAYIKAILYDNEPWQLTPDVEQQDPVSYYQQAYTLAHAHEYTFIAAPVPHNLDPAIASYADIVDVQAQYAQSSTRTYLDAVRSTIRQTEQANPRAIILSGLSTNPTAGDPTPQQLEDIAKATFSYLTHGWWLNIPNPGAACPRCHQARPDTAITFLALLGPTRQAAQQETSR